MLVFVEGIAREEVPLGCHGQNWFLCMHYNQAAGPNRSDPLQGLK